MASKGNKLASLVSGATSNISVDDNGFLNLAGNTLVLNDLDSGFNNTITGADTTTANRSFALPDEDGIIALTSDITSAITNAALIIQEDGVSLATTATTLNFAGSAITASGAGAVKTITVDIPDTNLGNIANTTSLAITSSTGTSTLLPAATASSWGVMTDEMFSAIAANTLKETNVTTNLAYTTAASDGTVTSSDGTDATIPAATTSLAGLLTGTDKTKLDSIDASAEVNVDTNLGNIANTTSLTITSSTGTSTLLPAATASTWGVMTDEMFAAIALNTAKITNVTTDLTMTAAPTTITIESSDGTNAIISAADTTNAGVMTKAIFDEHVLNNAKETNVSTNLGYTTAPATGIVTSSDGTNATIPAATTSLAGLLTGADKTRLDAIEDAADVTDAANVAAAGAVMESDTTTALMSFVIDEDTMISDSDTKIPTQQSVKAYVDGRVTSSVEYKGSYNAATNTPDLETGTGVTIGDMYTVTVAGTFFSGPDLEVGDVLISEANGPSTAAEWTVVNKDLNAASIKVSYESNADTNAYDDAAVTKLGNIEVGAQVNVDTNLGNTPAPTSVEITSSTGTNTTLLAAGETNAGVMTTTMYDEHVLNNAKVSDINHNVSTDLAYTTAASTGIVTSSDGTDATIPAATTSLAGLLTGTDKTKLDSIDTNAEVNVDTNLSNTATDTSLTIASSTGTNTALPAATTSAWGVMTDEMFDELAANTLKETNVSTDLSTAAAPTTITIESSDGTNAIIAAADTTNAGVMTKAIFDEHELNNAKETNVSTNLAYTTAADKGTITSDGTDAIIPAATTSLAGLLTAADKTRLDAIEDAADVTDATNVAAAGAVMEGDTTTALMSFVIDEDTMVSDLDTKIPTQQSVKAYVDGRVASSVEYKGGYNATTNTPDLETGTGITIGDMYTVTAAGTFYVGGPELEVGDVLISEANDPTTVAEWTVVNKDLNAASIKVSYESNADTNAYDDAAVAKLGGIAAGAQVNVDTNLSNTATDTSLTVESSTGTNTALPAATASTWGVMTDEMFSTIAANTLKETNVSTDLGYTTAASNGTVTSSDGTNATIPAATTSLAGLLTGADKIALDSAIPLTALSIGTEGTPAGNGAISYDDTTGIFTFTPPATVATVIDLANVVTDTSFTITSSNGNNTSLPAATTSTWGVMTDEMFDELAANTLKETNVSTDLSTAAAPTTITIESSDGNNAIIAAAGETNAGVMTTTMYDEHVLNNAKVSDINHNVTTNLAYTTAASTGTVTSSDGTNATIPAATTSLAGLLTAADKTRLDAIEDAADVTDAINVAAAGAVMEGDTTTTDMSFVIDEDTMISDSDTKIPTQQSVKAYVDGRVSSSVEYKGGYNADTNTPDLETGTGVTIGDMYTVTVAGTFFSGPDLEVGDVLISEADAPTTVAEWTVVNKDLDAASIKASYESNTDTNAYDDAAVTKLGSAIALTALSVGTEGTPAGNGAVSYDDTTGVFTFTPAEPPVGNTDLSNTATDTSLTVESSTGNNTSLPAVTTSTWGVMTDEIFNEHVLNNAKVSDINHNVSTDLGYTTAASNGTVTSSDGTNATIPAATTSLAGLLTAADKTALDSAIPLTALSVGAEGTPDGDGAVSYDNTTGVFTFTPAATIATAIDLDNVVTDTSFTITSSNGNNTSLPAATTSSWGVMTDEMFDELAANTLKETNVSTDLSTTAAPTTITIESSDGTNAIISAADTTNAGVMTKAIFDEHVLNNAKVSDINHNVSTDLGYTTAESNGTVTSSDGTNATIPAATTSLAGLLTGGDKTKLDDIEALADVTVAANVAAAGAVMEGDTTTADMSFVIDEDTMISDSDTKIPTQQSVKAYVDGRVASSVEYKGGYNADTNTPDLEAGTDVTIGDMYTVTVAGTFYVGGPDLEVGDVLISESNVPTTVAEWTVVNKDLDAASIKVSYESNTDTNAYDDAAVTKLGGIAAGAQVNVDTNLGNTPAPTSVEITSSTGTNTTLLAAGETNAGVMTTTMYDEHVLNNAKVSDINHNVSTNLSYTTAASTGTVTSSDGTNATIPAATTSLAGLLTGADKTALDSAIALTALSVGVEGTPDGDGAISYDDTTGVFTFTPAATIATSIDLGNVVTDTSFTITSSNGNNTSLPAATTSTWGVMTDEMFSAIAANTLKETNVSTALGYTTAATTGIITSDGTGTTIPAATTSLAGLLTAADKTALDSAIPLTALSIGTEGTPDGDGAISYDDTTGVFTFTPAATIATAIDLDNVVTDTSFTITSSNGNNTSLPAATTSSWGVMTDEMFDELAANTLKETNVSTDLSTTAAPTTITIESSDGNNAIITAADTTNAGVMTKAIFDEHVLNNAKVSDINHNVSTDLSITAAPTTITIESSDGTNAIITAADTTNAGVMTKAIFDEHVLNNAKETNVSTDLGYTTAAATGSITSSDGTNATIPAATTSLAGLLTGADKTRLDGIENAADVTVAANVAAAGAVMEGDTTTTDMSFVIDEDTMVSNSDTKIPTQQSVKAYVDGRVASSVEYKGGYDADTNTPDLETGTTVTIGDMYTVTVAGTFFSGPDLEVGDVLISEANGPTTVAEWTVVNKDLDAASIKASYESNTDTNAYDDAAVTKLGGIAAGAQVNVDTNLSNTATGTSLTVESSNGNNTSLPAATTSAWGVMTDEMFDELAANTLKETNVSTDLAYTTAASSGTVTSSDGTNATIPAATTSLAGLLTGADKTALDSAIPLTALSVGVEGTPDGNGAVSYDDTTGVFTFTPAATIATSIDLDNVVTDTSFTITSSNGNNTSLPAATTSAWGVMTDEMFDELAANTLKETNVSTDLSTAAAPTTITIESSDGTNAIITAAGETNAGVMTTTMYDEHVLNNAKVSDINHNVSTDLSTTAAPTTVTVNSSDGTNAIIAAADTTNAGVMTKAIFDEHVLNNAKVSDINHNVSTDLSTSAAPTTVTVNSSDGTNAIIAAADTTNAGVMTTTMYDEHVLNNAKVSDINHNVSTDLGYTTAASNGTVTSSDGTNATIPAATTSLAGLLTGADKTRLDGIADGAEVNVDTDLSNTATDTSLTVESSTGNNTSLPAATTSSWGVMTDEMFDELAANTLKETNVSTNLGYTTAASSGTVTSSDGTNATIPAATTSLAGLLTGADKTALDSAIPLTALSVGVEGTPDGNGAISYDDTTGIFTFTPAATIATSIDLDNVVTDTSFTITSSNGNNTSLPAATTSAWGVMTDEMFDELAANTLKETNVSTDLSTTAAPTTITIESSDGNNAIITAADTTNAGVMTKAIFDEHVLNNAKVSDINHNVSTDLGYTTAAANGTVTSSDGTNATIPAATTTLAGLLTGADKTRLDGIEDAADVTDATNVAAAGAVMEDDTTTTDMSFVIDEDTMVSDSDTKIPTQQSVKAYVDGRVASSVEYKGGYDADTNTPDLEAGTGITIGDMYTVTVAGTFLATVNLEIGDVLISEADTPTTATEWTVVNKDLDAASIKASYESNTDTNAYDDAAVTKLAGIATGANLYVHPDDGVNIVELTGAEVFSDITINALGHVTGSTKRDLTPANIGAASTVHTHTASEITDFDTEVANNTSVELNTAKETNVSTDLSTAAAPTTITIESSDGTNAIIAAADATNAGVMTKAIFDEHELNNAKETNVSTNLGYTTAASNGTVTSSDGTNATIPAATTSLAGLLTGADKTALDSAIPLTALSVGAEGTPDGNGSVSYDDTTGVFTFTPAATIATVIDLDNVVTDTSFTITSSNGNNTSLPAATTSAWGVMTDEMFDELAANTLKETNVSTNLATGVTTTTITIESSDGTNAAINTASTTAAGVMTKAIFDEHVLNNAKVSDINHNVTTNLSTTAAPTTITVNSSDGTNAIITAAGETNAGVMTTTMYDEHVLNNAKVSDINHNVSTDLSTTAAPTTVTVNSSDGTNAIIAAADTTNAGVMTKAIFDEHVLNNAKVSDINHNVSTDLSTTAAPTTVTVNSSDGTNAIIAAADTTNAGVMTKAIFDEHELNNAKVSDINHNVSTDLSTTAAPTTVTVNSSDGTNAIIAAADTTNAGVMTKAIFDEHVLNNAKETNVSTDLSTAAAPTTITIESSDGNNAIITAAGETNAGVMTTTMYDEHVLNNAKETNVSTDLSTAAAPTTITIESSDGTNAIITAAGETNAGVMTTTMYDEHVLNNAKVSDINHNVSTDLTTDATVTTITIESSDGTNAIINSASTTAAGVMTKAIFDEHELNNAKETNTDTLQDIAADATDATQYITFVPNTTGAQTGSVATGLTYNPSSNLLSVVDIALSGNASFADNGKVIFGADDDLEIYHDGTDSYISEQSTGNLKVLSANFNVMDSTNTTTGLRVVADAEVKLFHNNAVKLTTTADGIDIDGSLTISGDFIINGTTTTINSSTVTIDDPIFTLGGDTAPTTDDNKDRGVEFNYFDTTAKVGFFGFDDSTGKLTFIPDATNTGEVFTGTTGEIDAKVDWSNILNIPAGGGSDTTYAVSAVTGTGSAKLRLTGSDNVTDDVEFIGSGAITVTLTDDSTITIDSTDTNTNQLTTFTLTADSGTNQTIAHDDTLAITGGAYISTVVTADDTVTVNHDSTTRTDTTSTAAPATGETFTAVDGLTTNATGHITALNLKTVTLPADTNTDTLQDIAADATDANQFITFVPNTTGAQTGRADAGLTYNPSSNLLSVVDIAVTGDISVGTVQTLTNASLSTTAVTEVALYEFAFASYVGAEILITALSTGDSEAHITKLLVTHDDVTPVATEFGTVFTAAALATYEVVIVGANVRVNVTPASSDATDFKVASTLMAA